LGSQQQSFQGKKGFEVGIVIQGFAWVVEDIWVLYDELKGCLLFLGRQYLVVVQGEERPPDDTFHGLRGQALIHLLYDLGRNQTPPEDGMGRHVRMEKTYDNKTSFIVR
jgi:hypothetical protein